MRLQADPTVAYGLGKAPRSRLMIKQLQFHSPFNTYLYEGLPPGPICSPGRASIEAVINPADGVQDLYFVARGQGRHLFSQTYEQHLENIRLVRAAMAAADSLEAARDSAVAGVSPAPSAARSVGSK
jgi:UPF0755 protein